MAADITALLQSLISGGWISQDSANQVLANATAGGQVRPASGNVTLPLGGPIPQDFFNQVSANATSGDQVRPASGNGMLPAGFQSGYITIGGGIEGDPVSVDASGKILEGDSAGLNVNDPNIQASHPMLMPGWTGSTFSNGKLDQQTLDRLSPTPTQTAGMTNAQSMVLIDEKTGELIPINEHVWAPSGMFGSPAAAKQVISDYFDPAQNARLMGDVQKYWDAHPTGAGNESVFQSVFQLAKPIVGMAAAGYGIASGLGALGSAVSGAGAAGSSLGTISSAPMTAGATVAGGGADAAGLAQMAADAGLTGDAAQAFVNAGGMADTSSLAGLSGYAPPGTVPVSNFGSLQGVSPTQLSNAASLAAKGMTMADALKYAGVAAPVIGGLISSGAIQNASAGQQAATEQAIGQVTGSTTAAQNGIQAAQQAGVDTQNAALKEGLAGLQSQYDTGVTAQNASLDKTIAGITDANTAGAAGQTAALGQARTDLAPYTQAGAGAATRLSDLMGTSGNTGAENYGDLTKKFTLADFWDDPVTKASYQTGLDLGTKALTNQAARNGSINSGAQLKALNRFGVDYTGGQAAGSQSRFVGDQNNTYNRLTGQINTGQNATNSLNTLGFNTAQNIATQGNTAADRIGSYRGQTAGSIANAGNLNATNQAQMRTANAGNIAQSGNVASTNIANLGIGQAQSIAQLLTGNANAQGAAAIAQGNSLNSGITNAGNWWNSQDTLDKVLAQSQKNAQIGAAA